MALEGLLGRTKNMWRRQLSGSESSQGQEDIGTHCCVKFASWSILPTCEGGTSSGSLLVWNWVIERECSLGAVRKQFRTLSLEAFHGHSALGPSGDHYQIPRPSSLSGQGGAQPHLPRLGQTSSPGWGGTSQDWFLCSGSLVCVFLHLAASSYNVERIGKEKHSSGSWASCF